MTQRSVVVAVAVLAAGARLAAAAGTATQRCAATKIKAAGKAAACLLALDARVAGGGTADPLRAAKCDARLADPVTGAFPRAERRGGCLTVGDAATIESRIDGFVHDVDTPLGVGTPNACQAAKIGAAGKKAACLLKVMARGATGNGVDPDAVQRCRDRMTAAFTSAESRDACITSNDAAAVEATVDAFVGDVVAAEPASSTCATAGCPAPVPCDASVGSCWHPPVQARWQYQLQGAQTPSGACAFASTGGIDVDVSATPFGGGAPARPVVFDFDVLMDSLCAPGGRSDVDNTAAVDAVHALGAKAICYVDAGTDEPFRPDHQAYVDFDAACGGCLLGKPVGGFREERWLDVDDDRGQRTFVLTMIGARLDRCKADGFDAVELDNVDGYSNDTGFSLSDATQLVFDASLANLAHAKGLTVALKNDVEQVADLAPYFDMAVNEQCQQFDECATLDPFLAAGKPVFQVEYHVAGSTACPPASAADRNAILKTVDLFDTPWTPCR